MTTRTRRSTRSSRTMKSKLERAMGKTLKQVKRAAETVADVTGAVMTTAKKRVKKEMTRRRIKQKVRRAFE